MKDILKLIESTVYNKSQLSIVDFKLEGESKEYYACRYKLNGNRIVSRIAKVTPKKVGQFVTFWKRNKDHVIEPLHESDMFDFYIVIVKSGNHLGQFIFPKSILKTKGIISTNTKEGKRGFRVYSKWDKPSSVQAKKTQLWQSRYFHEIREDNDLNELKKMFL